MILGQVADGFPWVSAEIAGIEGAVRVEVVVDTGFEGDLAVHPRVLHSIGAALVAYRTVLMADGSERDVPHYEVAIVWDGTRRAAEAVALEGRPLVGCGLLKGFLLTVEMTDGGEVRIEEL
jgi:clan AA aspartic protease